MIKCFNTCQSRQHRPSLPLCTKSIEQKLRRLANAKKGRQQRWKVPSMPNAGQMYRSVYQLCVVLQPFFEEKEFFKRVLTGFPVWLPLECRWLPKSGAGSCLTSPPRLSKVHFSWEVFSQMSFTWLLESCVHIHQIDPSKVLILSWSPRQSWWRSLKIGSSHIQRPLSTHDPLLFLVRFKSVEKTNVLYYVSIRFQLSYLCWSLLTHFFYQGLRDLEHGRSIQWLGQHVSKSSLMVTKLACQALHTKKPCTISAFVRAKLKQLQLARD